MIKHNFNNDWEFSLVDSDYNSKFDCPFTQWQSVNLPHDWSTEFPFERQNSSGERGGYVKTGVGWYRKFFNIDHLDENERYIISFDGVYRKSDLFINGQKINHQNYGYIGFSCDLTKYLSQGLNLISVRCDCSLEPSSRWYNGCGITRNVYFSCVKNVVLTQENCILKQHFSDDYVNVLATVKPDIFFGEEAEIEFIIKDIDDNIISSQIRSCLKNQTCNFEVKISNPIFWSYENPNLYKIEFTSKANGEKDKTELNLGLRKLDWVANKGFFINDKPTKLKGVCLHHDGGCVGAAVPFGLLEKRIKLLKEMGCNAIRTSHDPFDPVFYDICDKNGMMVLDECFDGWDTKKADYDYGLTFEKDYEKDLTAFIKRDRNHPCVIGWSIGNEVVKPTVEILNNLVDVIHKNDDTRIITCGVNGISEKSNEIRSHLDVGGYNDGGGACFIYDSDHEKRPNQLFIATEAPHTWQTRGFYRTLTWWRDKNQPRIEIENLSSEEIFSDQDIRFSSSYDNSGVRTGVKDSWELTEQRNYLCGEFRWTGIDYLGEANDNEWPMKGSNSGVIDTANFKKDHYYLYQSMWTTKPMIHLLPHWTHNELKEGTIIPVCVYSTCEEIEVILNDKSFGKTKRNGQKQIIFNIPYKKGIIKAVGYNSGVFACEKEYVTADAPQNLDITISSADTDELDGKTYTEVICKVIDKNKNFVPNSNCLTVFNPLYGIEFLGSDNGCPIDMTNLKSKVRDAFNGLCMYSCKNSKDYSFIISSICAQKYFDDTQEVFLNSALYINTDKVTTEDIKIKYTLDGSNPSIYGKEYTDAFIIETSCIIKVAIYFKDKIINTISNNFIKGKKEKAVDLAHLNFEFNTKTPTGPFSPKVVGNWNSNSSTYFFSENGEFFRIINSNIKQKLGYWWYDYPIDVFENTAYAGFGEIWFSSGEKCKIKFDTQKCEKLIMDNESGAISTAYGKDKIIEFYQLS